jgi:hypothetical protein
MEQTAESIEELGEEEPLVDNGQPAGLSEEARQEMSVLEAQIVQIKQTYAANPQALFAELKTLVQPFLDRDHELDSHFQKSRFENAILIGTGINALYLEVIQVFKWGYFCKENFPGVSPSTLLNYRNIASRPDSHPYSGLGIARVSKLISLTRNNAGDDRIKVFLEDHGVAYEPGEPLTPQLRDQIDEALREAGRKTKNPVSVDKLTERLGKIVEEVVKAVEGLDPGKKSQVAEAVRKALEKIS